jgi:hypothetical protein
MDYLIDIGHLFKGTCGDDFALVPSKYSTICITNRRLSENPKDQQVSYKRVTRKCHMLKTFDLVLKTLWLNMKVKVPRVWCQDSKKSKYSCKSCKYGNNDKAAAVHITRIIFKFSNKPCVLEENCKKFGISNIVYWGKYQFLENMYFLFKASLSRNAYVSWNNRQQIRHLWGHVV